MQGFIKLTALGLTPSERALLSYGNTASAMGKTLNQMIEAVADASTNEFERLKEFGIKATQEKDTVTFTFQGISTTVKKEANAIEGYLQGIGENKFGDAMANQMERLPGKLSNLSDNTDAMFRALSNEGGGRTFASIISIANDAVVWVTSNISLLKDLSVSAFATIEKGLLNTQFATQATFLAIVGKAKEILPNLEYAFDVATAAIRISFDSMLTGLLQEMGSWLNSLANLVAKAPFDFAQEASTQIRDMGKALTETSKTQETFAEAVTTAEKKRKEAINENAKTMGAALDKLNAGRKQEIALIDKTVLTIIAEGQAAVKTNKALEDLIKKTKDAGKESKELSEVQQKLIDKLYPLETASREYRAELELINEIYKDGTPKQIEAIRRLQLQYAELFPHVARQEELAKSFEVSWVRAIERIDDSFFNFFRSGLDGFEDFKDAAIDVVKDLVAQILLNFAKVKLLNVSINASSIGSSVPASTAGSAASFAAGSVGGGLLGGATAGLLAKMGITGGTSGLLASIGKTFGIRHSNPVTTGGPLTPGDSVGGGFSFNPVDFAKGIGAGIAGNLTGDFLGDKLTGRETNSSIGATIETIAGSAFGPLGTFIGSTIGAFADRWFGTKQKDPRFFLEPTTQAPKQFFGRQDLESINASPFGNFRFASDKNLFAKATQADADQLFSFFENIAAIEAGIAGRLSANEVSRVGSAVSQQDLLYKKNSLDFNEFFVNRFNTIFDEIGGDIDEAFDNLARGVSPDKLLGSINLLAEAAFTIGGIGSLLKEGTGYLADFEDESKTLLEIYQLTVASLSDVTDAYDESIQSVEQLLPRR